jgi:hypothetical protein
MMMLDLDEWQRYRPDENTKIACNVAKQLSSSTSSVHLAKQIEEIPTHSF